MTIFASVIDKEKHRAKYANPWNPYEIALHFCMERLHVMLTAEKQHGKTVHVVFESRGAKEDTALELEFRRIAGNNSHLGLPAARLQPLRLPTGVHPEVCERFRPAAG